MNPDFRRWWRLLDNLPHDLSRVTLWRNGPRPPLLADGHLHPATTTVTCLEGVVRVVSPNHTIDLVAGETLVIGAGVWHRHEPLRRGSCWVGLESLPAFTVLNITNHERDWHGRLPKHPCDRLVAAILAANDDSGQHQAFVALLNQVLTEAVEDLQWDNPSFQRMITRLNANIHCGVHASDLVRASGLSRAQAYRVFKECYGVALKDAIDINRLCLAESLLGQGLTIREVAERSGWPSADTFARSWKRHHGHAPSQPRRESETAPAAPGLPAPQRMACASA